MVSKWLSCVKIEMIILTDTQVLEPLHTATILRAVDAREKRHKLASQKITIHNVCYKQKNTF